MEVNRLSKEYDTEVVFFLNSRIKYFPNNNGIFWCPCKICRNIQKHSMDVIFNHLGCDGIIQNYAK